MVKVILFAFTAFTSTLSKPTPCREIILSFLQLLIISSSNLAVFKVTASKLGSFLIKFSFEKSSITSNLKLELFCNNFIAEGCILLITATFGIS